MLKYPHFIGDTLYINPNESLKMHNTFLKSKGITQILHRFYGKEMKDWATKEEQKLYNKYMKLRQI